jgi:hypothetical protein
MHTHAEQVWSMQNLGCDEQGAISCITHAYTHALLQNKYDPRSSLDAMGGHSGLRASMESHGASIPEEAEVEQEVRVCT